MQLDFKIVARLPPCPRPGRSVLLRLPTLPMAYCGLCGRRFPVFESRSTPGHCASCEADAHHLVLKLLKLKRDRVPRREIDDLLGQLVERIEFRRVPTPEEQREREERKRVLARRRAKNFRQRRRGAG